MNRRLAHALVFLVLLAGNALLWRMMTLSADAAPAEGVERAKRSENVPERVGPWVGKEVAVDDKTVQILETDDIAVREYHLAEGDEPVWFAQVAGFGKRAAYHPPELCYVGSHYEVLQRGPATVTIDGQPRPVMRLVIGQDGHFFEAWYWFTANRRITASYYQQQWWLVRDALLGRGNSGTLVRVSTSMDHPDDSEAAARLRSFVEEFMQSTHPRAS